MKNSNTYYVWLVGTSSVIFVFWCILGLQGLDFTDEGYVMVAYQNFYSDPVAASYLFGQYLTVMVGAIWNMLFGALGYYSFRILGAIILLMSYLVICCILNDYRKQRWVIFGCFCVVMTIVHAHAGTLVFHYLTFSALTNSILLLLLYKAFTSDNNKNIGIASAFAGINIFVRIPSVILCVIPFILAFVNFCYHHQKRTLLSDVIQILKGISIGVLIGFLIIAIHGHLYLFVDNLKELRMIAADKHMTHNLPRLLSLFIIDNKNILFLSVALIVLFVGVYFFSKKIDINKRYLFIYYIFILAISSYFFKHLLGHYYGSWSPVDKVYAIADASIIFTFFLTREKKVVILLCTALLIAHLQPIGSDYGIINMGAYSIYAFFPIAITVFFFVTNRYCNQIISTSLNFSVISILCYLFVFIMHPLKTYSVAFRDSGNRMQKIYKVKSELASVYTSKERAEELDSFFKTSTKYFKANDRVLMSPDVPMLHYLSSTKPYLDHPWLTLIGGPNCKRKYAESSLKYGKPVIVIHDDKDFYNPSNYGCRSMKPFMDSLIIANKYQLVWKSLHFKIYK